MKKSISILLLSLILLFSAAIPSYAIENELKPNSVQVPVSYKVLSKNYISTVERHVRYITSDWTKASQYTVADGTSQGYSIGFSATAESIFKTAVKACGQFTISRTKTYTVTTYIPANKTKDSKLAFKADYKKYHTHMQKTSSLGVTSDLGWSYVYDPTTKTYLRVVYK